MKVFAINMVQIDRLEVEEDLDLYIKLQKDAHQSHLDHIAKILIALSGFLHLRAMGGCGL